VRNLAVNLATTGDGRVVVEPVCTARHKRGQIYCQVSHARRLSHLPDRPASGGGVCAFQPGWSPNDIYNALTITLESGALASIASTAATPLCERNYEVRIFGSKAILQLELWRGWMAMIDFADKRTGFEPLAETENLPEPKAGAEFVDSILGKTPNGSPGELGLASMEIVSKPPVNPRKQIAAKKFVKSKASAIKIQREQTCCDSPARLSQPVQLTGIAWDHSRAFRRWSATAQRYEETHPGVRIRWEKRTLDEFGHLPIDRLALEFDLIVIDHPWAGFAFERNLVRDLKPLCCRQH